MWIHYVCASFVLSLPALGWLQVTNVDMLNELVFEILQQRRKQEEAMSAGRNCDTNESSDSHSHRGDGAIDTDGADTTKVCAQGLFNTCRCIVSKIYCSDVFVALSANSMWTFQRIKIQTARLWKSGTHAVEAFPRCTFWISTNWKLLMKYIESFWISDDENTLPAKAVIHMFSVDECNELHVLRMGLKAVQALPIDSTTVHVNGLFVCGLWCRSICNNVAMRSHKTSVALTRTNAWVIVLHAPTGTCTSQNALVDPLSVYIGCECLSVVCICITCTIYTMFTQRWCSQPVDKPFIELSRNVTISLDLMWDTLRYAIHRAY